jgi:porphobilinogen synthase
MRFPYSRPRRLRSTKNLRDLIAETKISSDDLILPIFVNDTTNKKMPAEGLEGHYYYPPTSHELIDFLQENLNLGIRAFLVFGITGKKDYYGSMAYSKQGPVFKAVKEIRRQLGNEPVIFTDLCICNYTTHGHCGLPTDRNGVKIIDNDSTLKVYGKIAVTQAEAGADFVAPSGMMDGQVKTIREALDSSGFTDIGIMAYSAKYASVLYGPFRVVMESAPRFGDRSSYQMDPRNAMEALKEVGMDVEEGADIVMVKPALFYLDVIRLVKTSFPHIPLAAYNVSGEYMMIRSAAEKGFVDLNAAALEATLAIKRSGADIIISYFAPLIARLIKNLR